MAKNELIFLTKEGRSELAAISASIITVFTAGVDGSKILYIGASTDESDLAFYIGGLLVFSKTTYFAGENLLNDVAFPVDKNGNKYINIPASETISISVTGSGTGFVYGEDF